MTDTNKILPKLRFPEFTNDGEWKMQALGNCLLQAPDYGLNAPAVPYSPSFPTYLRITDIDDDGQFITDKKMSVDAEITDKNSLKAGDIVFARTGASVGKVYKYRVEDGSLIFAGFLIRARPDNSKYCSDYIFQYLFTEAYKRWINITSSRSGQPGINSNEYASLPIPFPTLPEQQKIASLLTSLDEQISAHKKKLEALKAHKKSLMQQLFPADGEKTPKLRFPEFKNAGEWEKVKLGESISVINPPKKLQSCDYRKKGLYPIIDQSQNYICGYTDDNEGLLNEGKDFLIVFGDHTCILKSVDFPFVQGADGIKIFRSKMIDCVVTQYIYQFLLSRPIAASEYKRHFSELKEFDIVFPHSLTEQQRIASSLSSIDDMIQAQDNIIQTLKKYKNGLTQQMFPHNN